MWSCVQRAWLFTVDLTAQGGTELLAINISEKLTMRTLRGAHKQGIILHVQFISKLDRKHGRILAGLLTKHINLHYMLHKMRRAMNPSCWKCGAEKEMSEHRAGFRCFNSFRKKFFFSFFHFVLGDVTFVSSRTGKVRVSLAPHARFFLCGVSYPRIAPLSEGIPVCAASASAPVCG